MSAEAKVIVSQRYNQVKLKPEQIARFWSRVDKTSSHGGCWLWMGYRNPRGYGMVFINHQNFMAHRMAYVMAKGEADEGMLCCHRCDNPACVNADHIFLGTHADNNRDSCAKSRHTHGERHANAKINDEKARQIKELIVSGLGNKEIARISGVSILVVKSIKYYGAWKHVVL